MLATILDSGLDKDIIYHTLSNFTLESIFENTICNSPHTLSFLTPRNFTE